MTKEDAIKDEIGSFPFGNRSKRHRLTHFSFIDVQPLYGRTGRGVQDVRAELLRTYGQRPFERTGRACLGVRRGKPCSFLCTFVNFI